MEDGCANGKRKEVNRPGAMYLGNWGRGQQIGLVLAIKAVTRDWCFGFTVLGDGLVYCDVGGTIHRLVM